MILSYTSFILTYMVIIYPSKSGQLACVAQCLSNASLKSLSWYFQSNELLSFTWKISICDKIRLESCLKDADTLTISKTFS